MEYLTVYDIADPRRLRRVASSMQKYGVRVQKSVFECDLVEAALRDMLSGVRRLMDESADSVRVYPLLDNSRRKQRIIGSGRFVEFPQAHIV